MSLKYAKIQKVYPNWYDTTIEVDWYDKVVVEEPPIYLYTMNEQDNQELEVLQNLKENQKLRIVDGRLLLENRIFSSIRRRISGDSRMKLLDHLDRLMSITENNLNQREILIKSMENLKITYRFDLKMKEHINLIIFNKKN